MSIPSITVGDEQSEVCIRKYDEDEAVLVVDNKWISGLSIGQLRSIHQAVGAYLALVKQKAP